MRTTTRMGASISQKDLQSQPSNPTSDAEHDDSDSGSDYEQTALKRKRGKKAQKPKPKKSRKTSAAATPNPRRPKKEEKPFPFLDLPAELRNAIYSFALSDDRSVVIHDGWKKYRRVAVRIYQPDPNSKAGPGKQDPINNKFAPALLCANRQIHSEAAAILYGNAIEMNDTTALYHFLGQVGSHRRFIKDITVNQWGHSGTHKAINHPAMTMLCEAVNLQRLHLNCHLHYSSVPKNTAQKFYRDAHLWLEAVGSRMKNKTGALSLVSLKEQEDQPPPIAYHRRWGWRRGRAVSDYNAFYEELARLLNAK